MSNDSIKNIDMMFNEAYGIEIRRQLQCYE